MKRHSSYVIGFLITWVSSCSWVVEAQKCGYESCPKLDQDMLNVHVIPHSHDDVGWLKTYDQYFYGSKTYIQRAGVQYILDSVLEELVQNPDRRFISVETAFFIRWWDSINELKKEQFRNLVQSGRLEFIGGGWTMNDEAAAHYNDIVDQMTLGLQTLRKLFGECGMPRVAWQIDPFGHSREQASLFSQMGFDGLFFGRLDYQDKNRRLDKHEMEFVWNSSFSLTGRFSKLFTGALFNGYGPPPTFCYDVLCGDDPIMDDKKVPDYNVIEKVRDFIDYCQKQASHYQTKNIAVTMGSDFHYQQAGFWYKNLDKLIKYVNEQKKNGSKVNLVYSTPSCYLKSLHDSKTTWTTKSDDFFPYGSDPHAYWTGYFTSRPGLKGYVRQTNNFLQICKQYDALSSLMPARKVSSAEVEYLKRAQGVAQHHDAISGTSKQAVQNDYVRLLSEGVDRCQKVISDSYQVVATKSGGKPSDQIFCTKLNVTECHFTEKSNEFVVTAHNPYGRPITHTFIIPVSDDQSRMIYTVRNPAGVVIESEEFLIPESVRSQPERNSTADSQLVFHGDIPALGFSTFFIKREKFEFRQRKNIERITGKDVVIKNKYLEATFDGQSGLLTKIVNLESGTSLNVLQNFHWYPAMNGTNIGSEHRASGAYVFRPNGSESMPVGSCEISSVTKGASFSEVEQVFRSDKESLNSWVSQIVRLYKNSRYLEMNWIVGPIPIKDGYGKEVISRFETPLQTDGAFFTDANGREIQRRDRNFRPTWHLNLSEPVSGNYYPVNSRIYIKDMKQNKAQLTVLTDRSVGGSSLKDGHLEIMVHRRLLNDDSFGVGEALNEPGFDGKGLVVRGKTMVMVTDVDSSAIHHRDLAQRMFMSPVVTFAKNNLSPEDYNKLYYSKLSGLTRPLPRNVHLLTLETIKAPYYLLRLEHFFEVGDDPKNLSKPVTVDVEDMFTAFRITAMQETMLAGDRLMKETPEFTWDIEGNEIPDAPLAKESSMKQAPFRVTLNPMQIRTFIIKVASY